MEEHCGIIAAMYDADPVEADWVVELPQGDDGFVRSQWYWIVLANGDKMLACYPRDSAYELTNVMSELGHDYHDLDYRPYDNHTTKVLIENAS